MTTIKTFAAVLSTVALFAATSASALTVSTVATGNVQMNNEATTSVGVQVNIGASGSAGASDQGSASDNSNASGNATANLSVPLVVTRADVDANNVQVSSVSADNVKTKSDLSGYIAAKLQSDANLYAVDTASDHVAVTYPERAQLFDVIPVTVETTATTDAGGNVSITQPWWSFLAASDNAALQSGVQSNVTNVLGANASTTAQLTASQQAQLVGAIESAMSVSYNASTNASANVNSQ